MHPSYVAEYNAHRSRPPSYLTDEPPPYPDNENLHLFTDDHPPDITSRSNKCSKVSVQDAGSCRIGINSIGIPSLIYNKRDCFLMKEEIRHKYHPDQMGSIDNNSPRSNGTHYKSDVSQHCNHYSKCPSVSIQSTADAGQTEVLTGFMCDNSFSKQSNFCHPMMYSVDEDCEHTDASEEDEDLVKVSSDCTPVPAEVTGLSLSPSRLNEPCFKISSYIIHNGKPAALNRVQKST